MDKSLLTNLALKRALKIELEQAKTKHRQARINLAGLPYTELGLRQVATVRLKFAEREERRAIRRWAPFAKEERVKAAVEAARQKRWEWRHCRLSRTTLDAQSMRAERKELALAASINAINKKRSAKHAQSDTKG